MSERSMSERNEGASTDLLAEIERRVEYRCTVLSQAQSTPYHPLRWYMSQDAMEHSRLLLSGVVKEIRQMREANARIERPMKQQEGRSK